MSSFHFVGASHEESRQRIRRTGIAMVQIHELARIVDEVDDEFAAIHALRMTYANIPHPDWRRSDEQITYWTVHREPNQKFYDVDIYTLEVHTWQPPLEVKNVPTT